jgi:hypothetical protein
MWMRERERERGWMGRSEEERKEVYRMVKGCKQTKKGARTRLPFGVIMKQ